MSHNRRLWVNVKRILTYFSHYQLIALTVYYNCLRLYIIGAIAMDLAFLQSFCVPTIVGICLCVGYVIKDSLTFIPNKYIPSSWQFLDYH